MSTDLKRMLQRRGLKKDLPDPTSIREGEICITTDTGEMYFVVGSKFIKTLTGSDVVNDLISTDIDKPLSANMGQELDTRISNINTYWESYTNNMLIEIEKKQDIIMHKGNIPPSDTNLIWHKI